MKIICIEGIDAVGKETTSKALEERLRNRGFRVERVSFPRYDKPIGAAIRDILNTKSMDAPSLSADILAPIYTLDRIQYFKENAERLSNECDYLILDRGFYSNIMYQASKIFIREKSIDNSISSIAKWIIKNYYYEFEDTGLAKYAEDIKTFVLTMPIEDSEKQIQNRDSKDVNESNRQYLQYCKQFVEYMNDYRYRRKLKVTLHTMANTIYDSINTMISYDIYNSLSKIIKYYVDNVYNIDVFHANTQEGITYSVNGTVNLICDFANISKENFIKNSDIEANTISNQFDLFAIFNSISSVLSLIKDISNNISYNYGQTVEMRVVIYKYRVKDIEVRRKDNSIIRLSVAYSNKIEKLKNCDCTDIPDMKISYNTFTKKFKISRIEVIDNAKN